jgi:hypothetical protein
MYRRSWAGEIVNLVYLYSEWLNNVVKNERKVGMVQKWLYIVFIAGEEIIQANHFVALVK